MRLQRLGPPGALRDELVAEHREALCAIGHAVAQRRVVEHQLLRQPLPDRRANARDSDASASLGTVTCEPTLSGSYTKLCTTPGATITAAGALQHMPLAIEHADHRAFGQQLELVQAFVPMCRNRPLVLAGPHADRLEVQAVLRPEVADFAERDDEKGCGQRMAMRSDAGNLHARRPLRPWPATRSDCLSLTHNTNDRRQDHVESA